MKKKDIPMQPDYAFRVDLQVRSYECDPQGIVNNSVYLQYLEHARCEWLKTMNLNYVKMSKNEQYLVVSKLDLDFKYPLQYDDDFSVCGNVWRPSHYHLEAVQDIYTANGKCILLAKVIVVGLEGRDRFILPQPIIDHYPLVQGNHA